MYVSGVCVVLRIVAGPSLLGILQSSFEVENVCFQGGLPHESIAQILNHGSGAQKVRCWERGLRSRVKGRYNCTTPQLGPLQYRFHT